MILNSQRQDNFFDVCGRCKISCCQNARPPITSGRRRLIEAYLKEHNIHIDNPFVHVAYTFPKEDAEGYCMFYDKKTRRCQVQSVKPETCVAGPITFDINTKSRKIEWYLKMDKICPLAGKLNKNEPMLKRHLESAKKEIVRLVRELNPEALQTILKIEEPETFKIDEDEMGKDILSKLMSSS
jgi:Fe-S-cluster containining protein